MREYVILKNEQVHTVFLLFFFERLHIISVLSSKNADFSLDSITD